MSYKLIKKTDNYIIINKPAGLLAHGAEHIKESTLAEELLNDFPEIRKIGDDPMRPGLLHRLDRDVSGLMVVARTSQTFDHIKSQFQNRTITKHYRALVYGRVDRDEGEIDFPIKRSTRGFRMAAIPKTAKGEITTEGRRAITEFNVAERYINYTLLKLNIKTGRTHQIRVHLSAYGYPIVGDDLYGTKKTRLKNKKLNLGRIFLVAEHLEFDDLKGERQKFTIALPEELDNFLKSIK